MEKVVVSDQLVGKTSSRSDEPAAAAASMLISLAYSGARRRFLCFSSCGGSKGSKPDDSCHRRQEWNPRTNRKASEWSWAA